MNREGERRLREKYCILAAEGNKNNGTKVIAGFKWFWTCFLTLAACLLTSLSRSSVELFRSDSKSKQGTTAILCSFVE